MLGTLPKQMKREDVVVAIQQILDKEEVCLFACSTTGNPKSIVVFSNQRIAFIDGETLEFKNSYSFDDFAKFSITLDGRIDARLKAKMYHPWGIDPKDVRAAREAIETTPLSPNFQYEALIESFGKVKVSGNLGGIQIRIYEKGFIALGDKPPAKLLGISSSINTSTNNGLGQNIARAATFVASAGLIKNIPNKQGNVSLTITTEKGTFVLSADASWDPNPAITEAMVLAIESGAKSLLAELNAGTGPIEVQEQEQRNTDITIQFERLAKMLQDGVITQDEFAQAKQKLLKS